MATEYIFAETLQQYIGGATEHLEATTYDPVMIWFIPDYEYSDYLLGDADVFES